MQVGIYTLKETLFNGEAVSVNCKTASGEITVLDHHRPLVSIIEKGTVQIVDKNGQEHYIAVGSGFLEMTSENHLKLIVD